MLKIGDYSIESTIGKGQFGEVYKATHMLSGKRFAIKKISKNVVKHSAKLMELLNTEIKVMAQINHTNLIHLHDKFETHNNYYLVVDYCDSGDMQTYLMKNKMLGEDEGIYFLKQLVNGFRELKRHKIMHRDLKLANIFLHGDTLKIGDFGLAKYGADMATTKLGTPTTMAPELLYPTGNVLYTNKADLWSIGVCFFEIIFGKLPWPCNSIQELKNHVYNESGRNLPIPQNPKTTKECRDLLRALTEPDAKKRMGWAQFFSHPLFINKPKPIDMRKSLAYRNNEAIVENMFNKNQEYELGAKIVLNDQKQSNPKSDASNDGLLRYQHERKLIDYLMRVSHDLRYKSKEFRSKGQIQFSEDCMRIALLLTLKGLLFNLRHIFSLQSKTDILEIKSFLNFIDSPEANTLLLELQSDSAYYSKLYSHIRSKYSEEVNPESSPYSSEIKDLIEASHPSLTNTQQNLQGLISLILKSEEFCSNIKDSVVRAYMGVNERQSFPYVYKERIFDWNSFETEIQKENTLNSIFSKITNF